MKKLLSILFSIFTLTVMAQVPQGVGYQGVATDANGIELVNQSISIRASVLSGSATGTIEWEETHATSTDTFGLFTLTIGQGTNTTNGAQTSFADISWGTNTYFLKIEMDVTGGSTYSNMGTNQMMSVPYALFAESANINYDSISNFLSGDSTFITNVGGGIGGDGCDILFPDGLDGEFIIHEFSTNYTVPAGKNLYITNLRCTHSSNSLEIDGVPVYSGYSNFTGGGTYILSMPILVEAGQVLSHLSPGSSINGYLVDENYFAGCGGGGSSTTSSLDSTAIANMIAAAGGGCDYSWPEGLNGTPIQIDLSSNYTVPSGKNLYIQTAQASSIGQSGPTEYLQVNGALHSRFDLTNFYSSTAMPLIVKSGDVISSLSAGQPATETYIYGILIDINTSITPIQIDLSSNYTVPSGKNLYIQTAQASSIGQSGPTEYLQVNGALHSRFDLTNFYSSTGTPLIVNAGDIISSLSAGQPATETYIYGYLADENYFAGCGGGGGSSSSSSLDSTAIANMIAAAGGSGCNWRFPDGLTGTPITWHLPGNDYTVPAGKNLYITAHSGNSNGENLRIDGFEMNVNNKVWNELIIVGAGSVVSTTSVTSAQWSNFNGILVDANVTPITWHLPGNDYTVPAGKNLYITAHSGNSNGENLRIDGFEMNVNNKNWNGVLIVGSGSVVSTTSVTSAQWSNFNGYLVDENYFAGCGGGGSSASSGLDSTTVAIMISNALNNSVSIGVGDYYQGGIVAYIFQPGDPGYIQGEVHGYIANLRHSQEFPGNTFPAGWGCDGIISGINNNNLGDGYNNTVLIASQCPIGSAPLGGSSSPNTISHGKFWNDLVDSGFDDWFIPNTAEADKLDLSVLPTSNFYLSEEQNMQNALFRNGLSTAGQPKDAGSVSIGIREF